MTITIDEVRKLRKKAAARKRPLVMHADGRPMDPKLDEVEKGEAPLIFPYLPGTPVAALTFSLIHQFNVSRLYRSKVCNDWPPGYVQRLYGDGPDGLEVYIDFCRQHGFEAWFAMRGNDTHDNAAGKHGMARWESVKFKHEHPECLHGTRENQPPHGRWSAMDFAQPLVRDQVFLMLEEVCKNYDIDGIQIDFFRHLNMFKSVAWGGVASAGEVEGMNDLMRRLRAMMDREGARRGRPILFSVRTPDSADYCRAIGLDIQTWLKEQLIDIWAANGYFQLKDWSDTVQLGHEYGCRVWACLDESRVEAVKENPAWRDTGYNSVESYRARAANAWRAGVDSIMLFNFFVLPGQPLFALLNELDDPKHLEGLDKLFVPDPLGTGRTMGPGRWLKDGDRFFARPPFQAETLAAGQSKTIIISVGEDLPAASARGQRPQVTLEVQARGAAGPGDLEVRLNGTTLQLPSSAGAVLCYRIDTGMVKLDDNEILIRASRELTLEGARLRIRYGKE